MNLFIKDLIIFNIISIFLALIFYGLGWSFINAISVAFLVMCAFLLIGGGIIGFSFSGVSLEAIQKFFRRRGEEEQEMDKKGSDKKNAERRERLNLGKRMTFIGLILLGESLLFSLVYILV